MSCNEYATVAGLSDEEIHQASSYSPRIPLKDVTNALINSSSTMTPSNLPDDDYLFKYPLLKTAGTSKKEKPARLWSITEYAVEDTFIPCLSEEEGSPQTFNEILNSENKQSVDPATVLLKRARSQSLNDLHVLASKRIKLVKKEIDSDDDYDDDDEDIDKNVVIEDENADTTETVIDNTEIDMPFPDLVKELGFDVEQMLKQRDNHGPMGGKAHAIYMRDIALAKSSIEDLYKCIQNAPKDDSIVESDPEGLAVPLMPHQRQALKWLRWRERQKPKGGILADDMGLGKTVQMIALILAAKNEKKAKLLAANPNYTDEEDESDDDDWGLFDIHKKFEGKTLVICPASLMKQWEREISKKVRNEQLSSYIYHGKQKMVDEKSLAKFDVVISSYHTVTKDYKFHLVQTMSAKDSRLYKIHWDRIILDEAHFIRNHTNEMSKAICELKGGSRWLLTGTPIQNKQEDFYALLKFLKSQPFDDLNIWRRFIDNRQALGNKRLKVICLSVMLRRTKKDLVDKKIIQDLPEKTIQTINVNLDGAERIVYQKLLLYSQGFFYEFLRRREEKLANSSTGHYSCRSLLAQEVPERLSRVMKELMRHHDKNLKTNFILVLITRLRQICCHPALIKSMLDTDFDVDNEDGSLYHKMSNTILEMVSKIIDEEGDDDSDVHDNSLTINSRNLMSAENPVFSDYRVGSKVRKVLKTIDRIIDMGDKMVVVSQWTGFLQVIANNLTKMKGAKFATFSGKTNVKDRQLMVDRLNDPRDDLNVLLLSLTAGAVGLNLVGANHLLLIDLHWNPQLENQAMDRIHRFGQRNDVQIYRFICKDTIEENIRALQENKLKIADSVLLGNIYNKLTIENLKSLFSVQ